MAMSNREKVTACLIGALPSSALDATLLAAGFTRADKSLLYLRKGSEIDQQFKLTFDVSPSYEPTALAHVLPQVVLESKLLGALVRQMEGERGASGQELPPVVVGHQLQNLAPKDHRGDATRWFIHEEAAVLLLLDQVDAFAQTWAVPFLNQYQGVRSLIEGYECGDERLRVPKPLYLYVVAAYLQVGEGTKALSVLERVFGRPALRKQYTKAFDYVRERSAS